MPISRKKSCIHCRRAKARCNLASTCSRCSDRELQCSYAPFSSTVLSETRLEELTPLEGALEQVPENHSSPNGENADIYAFNFTASEPTGFSIEDLEWPTPSGSSANLNCLVAGGLASGAFGEMAEQPDMPPSSRLFSNDGHVAASQGFVPESNDGTVTINGQVYHDLFSPRNSINTHSLLASRFIRGQLKTYPTLLLHGQLPPFIYPSCVLSDQLPQSCVVKGVHQCLAPPLAVCASLVRIWEACTPATAGLVWRSIYAEVKRLGDEHREYDDDELLGAFQAMSVYLLLQAQDLRYKHQNDLLCMGLILMDITRHLWQSQSGSHLRNLFTLPNLTQRVWAFNESIRRTMALLFILDSLLREGSNEGRDPMRCGSTEFTPLPGSRNLWDYHIRDSWAFRLEQARSSDGGLEPQLTLGDLRKAEEGDKVIIDRLASWCEGADEFGGLLRMSALLV